MVIEHMLDKHVFGHDNKTLAGSEDIETFFWCGIKKVDIVNTKKRVSKGEYPLGSRFPIGASSIPVGTRFSVGKSSVLYLCSRLTSKRGWLRHLLCGQIAAGRHFSVAVGQTDFVRSRTKCGFAYRAKSVWPEKGAEVYIRPSSRCSVTL